MFYFSKGHDLVCGYYLIYTCTLSSNYIIFYQYCVSLALIMLIHLTLDSALAQFFFFFFFFQISLISSVLKVSSPRTFWLVFWPWIWWLGSIFYNPREKITVAKTVSVSHTSWSFTRLLKLQEVEREILIRKKSGKIHALCEHFGMKMKKEYSALVLTK